MAREIKPKFTTPEELEKAKPNVFDWTTRELRMWIRGTTKELNKWAKETPEEHQDPLVIDLWHKTQESLGGVRDDMKLVMNLTYKRKPELVRQVRKLKELRNFNIFADNQKSYDRMNSARNTFNTNYHTNLTEEEYSELVDVFGSSPDYFNTFGYEDFVNKAAEYIHKLTASEFIEIVSDVMNVWRNTETGSKYQNDAMDYLTDRIKEVLKNKEKKKDHD